MGKLRKVCSWCDKEMEKGESIIVDTTHVICPDCAEKFEQEFAFDFEEKEVGFQIT